eukprot:maker-scaffold_18-snap-gene-2.60-mRNA-1 protein AED:0.15 eAED:0.15 QI:294/1/1/1/1/1/2/859/508
MEGSESLSAASVQINLKLKEAYERCLKGVEEGFSFAKFYEQGPLGDREHFSLPLVLVLGGMGTGKSQFIRSMVGEQYTLDYPFQDESSEKFTIVYHDYNPEIVTSLRLSQEVCLPLDGIQDFKPEFFKDHLQGAATDSPLLQSMVFVEAPALFKYRDGKFSEYNKAITFFAKKATKIIWMFDVADVTPLEDPKKSQEAKNVMSMLARYEKKLSIVLNKCDADRQKNGFIRDQFGKVNYFLGKFSASDRTKNLVYPPVYTINLELQADLEREKYAVIRRDTEALINFIQAIPRQRMVRKVKMYARRAVHVKNHAIFVSYMRTAIGNKQMFGKKSKIEKEQFIQNIDTHLSKISQQFHIARNQLLPKAKLVEILHKIPPKELYKMPILGDEERVRIEQYMIALLPRLQKAFDNLSKGGDDEVDIDYVLTDFSAPMPHLDATSSGGYSRPPATSHSQGLATSFSSPQSFGVNNTISRKSGKFGLFRKSATLKNKKKKLTMASRATQESWFN